MMKEREARTTSDEVVIVLMMSLKSVLSLLAKRLDHVSISIAKNISRNRTSATDVESLLGYYNFQNRSNASHLAAVTRVNVALNFSSSTLMLSSLFSILLGARVITHSRVILL